MSLEVFDQRLSSLKADLKLYGDDIVEHISSLYECTPAGARFELKNDPFSMLSVLQIDVIELVKEAQEKSNYKTEHANDIEECQRLSHILGRISSLVDKISECEILINKLSIVPACRSVHQIEVALGELPKTSSEIGMGNACRALRKEHKLLQCRLSSKLNRIFKECIQFEYGHISVHRELKGILRSEDKIINDSISLIDIWDALNLFNQEDIAIDIILRNLWIYILKPLWREKKLQSPRSSSIEEATLSEFILDNIVSEGKALECAHRQFLSTGKSGSSRGIGELGACRMPLPQLLDCLGQVFAFVWTEVLCENEKAAESMVVKLNEPPFALIPTIIATISHQLPKSESELAYFRRTLEGPCKLFEAKLRSFGFLPEEEEEVEKEENSSTIQVLGPLTSFITDLPSIFADLRRREILKAAREVVLSDYHNTMMAAGDAQDDELASAGDIGDSKAALEQSVSFAMQKLRFDSCQTSLAACRLLKLVHDVMKQASAGAIAETTSTSSTTSTTVGVSTTATAIVSFPSPHIAHALYQAARDCLELFTAIVPMQFADVIDTVPRMGAVFYNDCLYIAHNCTLITHRYRLLMGKIDPSLEHTVGFADFIPRFRSLGDRCLVRHIEEQRTILTELVQRIRISPDNEGGGNTSSGVRQNDSSGTGLRGGLLLRGGLALAEKLSGKVATGLGADAMLDGLSNTSASQWNNDDAAVLVRRHMERLSGQWLGVLQDGVYSRLLGHLFDGILQEAMKPILTAECIAEAAGAEVTRVYRSLQHIRIIFPTTEDKDDENLHKVCSNWRKFLALTDLLEYSLSDVAEWLPRKKFASFTGTEMTSLIRALFEDSPRRQTILTSILEMSS